MAVAPFPSDIRGNSRRDDLLPESGREFLSAALEELAGRDALRCRPRKSAVENVTKDLRSTNPRSRAPQIRTLSPAQSAIHWFLQGRCEVEELLLQLYYGRLSMAGVDSVVSQLWGEGNGAVLLAGMIPSLGLRLDQWIGRPIEESCPYIFLHGAEIPRRKIPHESVTRVALAAGIDERGYRVPLGVHSSTAAAGKFWSPVLKSFRARGLRAPQFVVGDPDPALRAAVREYWPASTFLPFDSNLDRELMNGVGFNDRSLVSDLLVRFRTARTLAEAKLKVEAMKQALQSAGYARICGEMAGALKDHLGYFAVPCAHRVELRKLEVVQTQLNRLREQIRIIGPVSDHRVLVHFAAAALRRVARTSWNAKPVLSFE